MEFCVYILASFQRTLYVGVTNNLARRLTQHQASDDSTFTGKYNIRRLVHVEVADSPMDAIEREKQIKRWGRAKKIALIESLNPEWRDMSDDILGTQSRPLRHTTPR